MITRDPTPRHGFAGRVCWTKPDAADLVDPIWRKTVEARTWRAAAVLMQAIPRAEASLGGQKRRFLCKFSGTSMFELKQRLGKSQQSAVS